MKLFLNYLHARYNQDQEEYGYRIYVTDSLYLQGQNKMFVARWNDLINQPPSEYDDMNGDEIAVAVMQKAGLTFKKGGE